MPDEFTEETVFIPDSHDNMTTPGKNRRLANRINTDLVTELIVRIERIEIASKGWRVIIRKPVTGGGQ